LEWRFESNGMVWIASRFLNLYKKLEPSISITTY
jgi:hypothetical protein